MIQLLPHLYNKHTAENGNDLQGGLGVVLH